MSLGTRYLLSHDEWELDKNRLKLSLPNDRGFCLCLHYENILIKSQIINDALIIHE